MTRLLQTRSGPRHCSIWLMATIVCAQAVKQTAACVCDAVSLLHYGALKCVYGHPEFVSVLHLRVLQLVLTIAGCLRGISVLPITYQHAFRWPIDDASTADKCAAAHFSHCAFVPTASTLLSCHLQALCFRLQAPQCTSCQHSPISIMPSHGPLMMGHVISLRRHVCTCCSQVRRSSRSLFSEHPVNIHLSARPRTAR